MSDDRGLSELPAMLEWETGAAAPVSWRAAFLAALDRALIRLAEEGGAAAGVAAALDRLPAARKQRVLRSPWLSYALLRDRESFDLAFAAGAALAEEAREGRSVDTDVPLWTSHGDECFVRGRPIADPPPELPVALDEASPFPVPPPEARVEPLDAMERASVRRRLSLTLEELAGVSPGLVETIARFDEVIAVRATPGDRFRCGSHDRLIGIVVLRNAHLDRVGPTLIADALVHESIHNMLRNGEAVDGRFVRGEPTRIESPWSGQGLTLHSYVHACAVWYGLFRLWDRADRAGSFEPDQVALVRERAAAGFRRRPVSRLDPFLDRVVPAMIAALREMEARMA